MRSESKIVMSLIRLGTLSKQKLHYVSFTLALLLYVSLCLVSRTQDPEWRYHGAQDAHLLFGSPPITEIRRTDPVFVFAICKGKDQELKKTVGGKFGGNIQRQIEQASVLIKSASVLTSQFIRFIILVDQDILFEALSEKLSKWPFEIRHRFELSKRKVWFPKSRKEFRTIYRVCSTERVFIINQLPDIDSIIYLDTDMIFMRPPEELWNHFNHFDSNQLSGMAPCLTHYDEPQIKFPYYGETGLNAGVWMMNLTRMRDFPGGWINTCLKVYDKYKKTPYFGLIDQDVANVIFNKNPEYLFELGCQWNFRILLCTERINKCHKAEETGISLVHGNALAFYADKDMKIKRLYQVWEAFDASGSLKDLLHFIRVTLKEVDEQEMKSDCGKIKNFDLILTKGLESYVQSLE